MTFTLLLLAFMKGIIPTVCIFLVTSSRTHFCVSRSTYVISTTAPSFLLIVRLCILKMSQNRIRELFRSQIDLARLNSSISSVPWWVFREML